MRVNGMPVPLDPGKPAMLTLYIGSPRSGLPIDRQTSEARGSLFASSYAELELRIHEQLQTLFGSAASTRGATSQGSS